ncbi:MAG: branched-chain amino acid transport ATP-binding protein LivF [Burkholderiaceae bacterium]|jgi:ABC-type branched-subunit amino acid transport system ATPase component|nr:MAG: branched-chain amino acid transport ATP-binding protein LivF [Burkholderiaceae bacterium]
MNRDAQRPLLRFENLAGGYGDTAVLRGLDGGVAPARTLGVLGRNGVGKTTLLRLLMGYNRPFSGTVHWRDRDLARLPPFARRRIGISYAPQESVVFDELTVFDNLTLHRTSRVLDDYARYFDAFPRLAQRLRQLAGSLSGGEKKLVSFVRVLAESSPLTLLDEPTEGVQQENIAIMAALVGVSEFLCARCSETCPRRRASLATNAKPRWASRSPSYAPAFVNRSS